MNPVVEAGNRVNTIDWKGRKVEKNNNINKPLRESTNIFF